MSAPAKAVYLIAPGYRRWITPDATELVFETEGFAPNESTSWQANLTVRDLDSDAQTQSTTPIELSRNTFTLPVPNFHRRAEIILFIEDRRREPVAEGRWKLTNIPKEELAGLSYFDSRGVFFHEGVGRFPIVAMSHDKHDASNWELIASMGFSGLIVPVDVVDEKTSELARSLKLLLFPLLGKPGGAAPETSKAQVRRVMQFSVLAAYGLAAQMPSLMTCRAVDPTRPVVTVLPLDHPAENLGADFEGYQDVFSMQYPRPTGIPLRPSCVRSGRPHFGWMEVKEAKLGTVHSTICTAVARGASGFALVGEEKEFSMPILAQSVKDLAPVVNAVVRGTPLPSDDSTDDHWFWRRRLGPNERAVIEVKRGEPPTATFKIEKTET